MVLFSLVSSHKNVDLNTVAQVTTGVGALPSTLVPQGGLEGLVVLSTCNRLELYAEAPGSRDALQPKIDAIVERIAVDANLDPTFVRGAFDVFYDDDAASHLFTVVSGLESAVVGEREITGQVRRALVNAREEGSASNELVRLFETAARTARSVGTQTSLGERGRSIVSVALDLASEVAARPLEKSEVLVFGTGAYAGATMAALQSRGCHSISVYSASGRSAEFTAKRGGTPVSDASLDQAMHSADIIIGCSGGSAPMDSGSFPEGSRVVVDLALTRDFDPSIADLDGVELITLESVRLAAPAETDESVSAARAIVEKAAREFRSRRNQQNVDSAIVALRKHTMSVLDAEMKKVRHQYGCGAQAEQVEFAMRRMMHSLLHTPMVKARKLAAEGREQEFMDAIEALYDITLDAPEDTAPESVLPGADPTDFDGVRSPKAS
ncbi:glutamyl-tRNA reductase [Kocuria sp. HSID16901]|uniref:glutamyl-tRNA reductase n=1 Tax=Kocuria sp. HSID16901 TaxID=2419505 RepID=UPI000660FC71|nr:glutamyl-tRNA reductase [Kocuria sp. HSID16901]RUQ22309.1 glutamyl-tRNA reductase [Kocuria sp. HSID16901]